MKKIDKYLPTEIEPKWQKKWEEAKVFSPDLNKADKPFYNLMMFPYPSAEGMHVGNMYAFTGSDIYGRYQRLRGKTVFEPIGLDGFGIHSENYALKMGRHPKEQAKISEQNFYRQLKATGNAFDWSRTVESYKPEYYKWTQWLFIQLFKAGLAYRQKAPVNYCPSCKTVLADEQVVKKVKSQNAKAKSDELDKQKLEEAEFLEEAAVADDKTGISVCERCETRVEKKQLEQWFFRITKYAERLLANLGKIDWSEKVKIAQKNWIGKSEGTTIKFKVHPPTGGSKFLAKPDLPSRDKFQIEVFTVFPETIFGVTYMVLAPEHPLVTKITTREQKKDVEKYIQISQSRSEIERMSLEKEKTGVFTGAYCLNPVNNERIPIWIADYVLAGYGTGAVMGVPGSDHRDFEFAKKYLLPIRRVIGKTKDDVSPVESEEDVLEEGVLVNSEEFSGLSTPHPAKEKIKNWLVEKGYGQRKTEYHLRDWLISRQRYWGPPIPIVFCANCAKNKISNIKYQISNIQGKDYAIIPVPEEELPVLLPDVKDWKPMGTGESPLANHQEFYKTTCPKCGGEAKRETDVSDTFLDSSWYFLRYLATERSDIPFPVVKEFPISPVTTSVRFDSARQEVPRATSKSQTLNDRLEIGNFAKRARWLPVDMYIGGAEHSVLHLLYARFITMVLKDLGFVAFDEPFKKFRAHGLIIAEGEKMSKSKGNVVVPDEYIRRFGSDTLRMYLMFMAPFTEGGDFRDSAIEGIQRFLKRVWQLTLTIDNKEAASAEKRILTQTIKKVTEDIESLRYNTAISALMELLNFISRQGCADRETLKSFLILLAPFAPHITEELYQRGKGKGERGKDDEENFWSIHLQPWPSYEPELIEEEEMTIAVQVNGKVRDTISVQNFRLHPAVYRDLGWARPASSGRAGFGEASKEQKYVEDEAKKSEKVARYLEGKEITKVIYVPGRIINFLTPL